MYASLDILFKTVVKRYYQQNAGFFLFIFVVFFGVLPPGQQLTFHYRLISGMLEAPVFFAFVLSIWFLFGCKNYLFVRDLWNQVDYSFIRLLSRLDIRTLLLHLFFLQICLYLPVMVYSLAVVSIAVHQGALASAFIVLIFIFGVCIICSSLYLRLLTSPRARIFSFLRFFGNQHFPKPYFSFLLAYIFTDLKAIFVACKLISCILLFRLLEQIDPDHYDLRMPMLVFSVGLFGHGVLLFKIRNMDSRALLFWRSLPVALYKRFLHYAFLCLLILLPEMIGFYNLASLPLHSLDAFIFCIYGFSLVLLMNSILHISPFNKLHFLKILMGIFVVTYLFILSGLVLCLSSLFIGTALLLFFRRFYEFENGISLM
jgi:hypothetical protein